MPSFDAAGKVVRLHGTDQNISARKLLDRLQTHVAHLSRLEAMNAMAATLAHELNQPLTAASNYLNGSRRRLKKGGDGAFDAVREGLEAAGQQVHLAADILRRVREMVANQPRTVTTVPLARVVEDALALVAIAGGAARPAVHTKFAADARSVRADRIQFQQVMINLIGNACEATKGRADAEIVIESVREGDFVAITVADNGAGFSQPSEARFSPFATTREAGLGLGLSISRTIIESHGGRIWTGDREGGGAVVGFTLPAPRRQRSRDAQTKRLTRLPRTADCKQSIRIWGSEMSELKTGGAQGYLRIATEEAFAPPELMDLFAEVLDGDDVDPGFESLMGFYMRHKSERATDDFPPSAGSGRGTSREWTRAASTGRSSRSPRPARRSCRSDKAKAISVLANDRLAEACARHPDRFTGMAACAPQDPAHAAKEIERAVTKLGMRAVVINSHTHGEYLSDRKFWPILEAAEALDVPIYLHPQTPPRDMIGPMLEAGLDGAVFGFGVETGFHAFA